MGLRETLEAATPGPWAKTDGWMAVGQRVLGAHQSMTGANVASTWGENGHNNAALIALAPELAAEVLELRERHREAMALALDWGNWTRDFLLGDNIDPGDRADLTALLARLDQIGVADETRLGKEQTDG